MRRRPVAFLRSRGALALGPADDARVQYLFDSIDLQKTRARDVGARVKAEEQSRAGGVGCWLGGRLGVPSST